MPATMQFNAFVFPVFHLRTYEWNCNCCFRLHVRETSFNLRREHNFRVCNNAEKNMWTQERGSIRRYIMISCGLLWARWWIFVFHKEHDFWVAKWLTGFLRWMRHFRCELKRRKNAVWKTSTFSLFLYREKLEWRGRILWINTG